MTYRLFPDNTVLCNFAAVDHLKLLRAVVADRVRWTEAVAYEASRSAAHYPDLARIADDGWLGEPIEIDGDQAGRVERMRRQVFGPARRPLDHLGEARTLFLIREDPSFRGSTWISEDRAAGDFARRQNITTWDTLRVLEHACASFEITAREAYDLTRRMLGADRHLHRVPSSPARFG